MSALFHTCLYKSPRLLRFQRLDLIFVSARPNVFALIAGTLDGTPETNHGSPRPIIAAGTPLIEAEIAGREETPLGQTRRRSQPRVPTQPRPWYLVHARGRR